MTRIEIWDTRQENAMDTITAEINPPEPLRVVFSYGGGMTASYTDYNGLSETMRSICKNWKLVRRLKVLVELDNKGEGNV